MSKSVRRVTEALKAAGIETEMREMSGTTRTAAEAAEALGCEIDQIAKSIILRGQTTGTVQLFITAGGNRVNRARASELAGEALGKADAAFVREVTGFVIGGVAPLGHLTAPVAFFDPRLLDFETVYAAGGTPRHIFPVSPVDLLSACNAKKVEFTE